MVGHLSMKESGVVCEQNDHYEKGVFKKVFTHFLFRFLWHVRNDLFSTFLCCVTFSSSTNHFSTLLLFQPLLWSITSSVPNNIIVFKHGNPRRFEVSKSPVIHHSWHLTWSCPYEWIQNSVGDLFFLSGSRCKLNRAYNTYSFILTTNYL